MDLKNIQLHVLYATINVLKQISLKTYKTVVKSNATFGSAILSH